MTAERINNFVKANANRRRRQTTVDVDPVYNFAIVAATLEVSTDDTSPSTTPSTNPPSGGGGAAGVIITSYSLLLASLLLAVLMI